MEFSERLKAARKKNKLKQSELAEKSGVSLRMLSRYESGAVSPSMKVIEKLAAAMDISPEELVADDEPKAEDMTEKLRMHAKLLSSVLLAGGDKIPEEDRDEVLKIILKAYTESMKKD